MRSKIYIIAFILMFCSTNMSAQQNTQIKLNVLPLILNGYGFSIEQRVFQDYAIEAGMTTFDRITLILDASIPKLENPFRELHFYTNIFRNISFAKNHFLQFGTQFNLYSRSQFSNVFINAFTKLYGELPNSDKLFVTSILLGYKAQFSENWNLGFQLAYNLSNKTETQSAFSVTFGYGFNAAKWAKKEIFY